MILDELSEQDIKTKDEIQNGYKSSNTELYINSKINEGVNEGVSEGVNKVHFETVSEGVNSALNDLLTLSKI